MSSKSIKFIVAIAVQVVIIAAIIIFKVSVLAGGTDVMLRIQPIDPRDMLRGDYVTFRYNISNIDSYQTGGEDFTSGDNIYVLLYQGSNYASVNSIQKTRPSRDELFIQGRVESVDSQIRVVYGIEQYFIPEGKGRNFSFANKEAAARVVVDDQGNAVLKQIYIDGKLWP